MIDPSGPAIAPPPGYVLDPVPSSPYDEPPLPVGEDPQVKAALGKLIAPTAAAVGMEGAATLAGLPEVGLLPSIGRAAIGGITNLAVNRYFPERFGGDPNASIPADIAWGALPEIASAGGRTVAGKLFQKHLDKVAGAYLKQGESSLLDPENLIVQERLLRSPASVPFPEIAQPGPVLTQQANEAREPIIGTINAARHKYGEPIGNAYALVKDIKQPVDTGGFANFVDRVHQNQISPSPTAEKYLQQLRDMDPAVQQENFERAQEALRKQQLPPTANMQVPDELNQLAQGYGYPNYQQLAASQPDFAQKLQEMAGVKPSAAPAALPAVEFKPRPISFDTLRDMRQRVNLDLQKAKGGDRYALGAIQDHLDELLMDKLPPEMGQLRSTYRGFIKRWGYERERAIMNLADPNEIAQSVFKNPRDAYELYTEAGSPDRANKIREGFVQYVWGDLPQTEPGKVQAAAVRKRLAPYMTDPKVARAMLGDQPGRQYSQMVAWARYAPDLQQQLEKNPKAKEAFDQSFKRYFLQKKIDPTQATTAAMQDLMRQLPNAPSGMVDITGRTPLITQSHGGRGFGNVLAGRHGAMTALSLGLGRPDAALYQAAMALSWLAHSDGFNASSKMGITREMLNVFKSGTPTKAGYLFARALDTVAHGGAQAIRMNMDEPVEVP